MLQARAQVGHEAGVIGAAPEAAEISGGSAQEPGFDLHVPGQDVEPEGLLFRLGTEMIPVGEEDDLMVGKAPAQMIDGTEHQGLDTEIAELASDDEDALAAGSCGRAVRACLFDRHGFFYMYHKRKILDKTY